MFTETSDARGAVPLTRRTGPTPSNVRRPPAAWRLR